MAKYNFLDTFQIKSGVVLKNKIVMAPMTTASSFHNGMITTDEIKYYEARSGGPGMVITGVANVSENGKGFEGELSITNDDMLPGLHNLANAIKKDGSKAILQIFHAGRKSTSAIIIGETPVSASAIAATYPKDSETPRELTNNEILQIIKDFGSATRRAIIAGFDGIELHGANTYLLQQFYSENSNQRNDSWGGSRENRLKFALEVIKEVKQTIDEYANEKFILGYRISPEEIETPGIRLEDSLFFVETIKDSIDYLHLSMASYKRTSLNNKHDNKPILTHFSEVLNGSIPLVGVGSIEKPADADEALSLGADLAAIGRELIREPLWVQKVSNNDEENIRTDLSSTEMNELSISPAMQEYIKVLFFDIMNFTTNSNDEYDFTSKVGPMENLGNAE